MTRIDGNEIQRAAVERLQGRIPVGHHPCLTIMVPRPDQPRAFEAYISARQKRKIFEALGFRVSELSPASPGAQRIGGGDFYVIQRPLQAPWEGIDIDAFASDLEDDEAFGIRMSSTVEAVCRLIEPRLVTCLPVGMVGAQGAVGTGVCAYLHSAGCEFLPLEIGDPLDRLRGCRAVVAAAGRPGLITPAHLGSAVDLLIDVGFTYDSATGRADGDVRPDCQKLSAFFTPVPGGVGPLQVITLAERALRRTPGVQFEPWTLNYDALPTA